MSTNLRVIAVLLAGITCLAGCDDVADLIAVDPTDLLAISVSASSMPADGESTVVVTAVIPSASSSDAREVDFTTTLGEFVGPDDDEITVDASVDGVASARLRASTTRGIALITVDTDGVIKTLEVEFAPAYPERLLIESDMSTVSIGDFEEVELTVTLQRNIGAPTQGALVRFRAEDRVVRPIGTFRNITTSDDSGQVEAIFFPGDTSYRGLVYLIATYTNPESGAILETRIPVEVID